MHITIISAGPFSAHDAELSKDSDLLIACDAGWKHCERYGLKPNIIVGDFDSSHKPDNFNNCIVLPHVKDDTDTQYAARIASEKCTDTVTLLGCIGGQRLDHMLANISTLLWLEKHQINAEMTDKASKYTVILSGESKVLHRNQWFFFSVFPLEGNADVDISGDAFYRGSNIPLTADFPIGVSNEFTGPEIMIHSNKGPILVVESISDNSDT